MNRTWTVLAGLVLAVGFVALSIAPAEAARHEVKIEQYAYGPGSLSISQGDTVTWTNLDTAEHDVVVTSGPESFRSPMLSKGQSWSHTFTAPGDYSYICSVHPDMRASVSAAAAPTASAPASPTPAHTPANTPSPTPTQAAAPTPTPSATVAAQPGVTTTVPAAATSTLNPLLLVAGASVAVVVFCLLLMASRPVYPPAAESPTPVEEPGVPAD